MLHGPVPPDLSLLPHDDGGAANPPQPILLPGALPPHTSTDPSSPRPDLFIHGVRGGLLALLSKSTSPESTPSSCASPQPSPLEATQASAANTSPSHNPFSSLHVSLAEEAAPLARTRLLVNEVFVEDAFDSEDEVQDDDDVSAPAPTSGANLHGVHATRALLPSTTSPSSLRPTSGLSPRPLRSLSPHVVLFHHGGSSVGRLKAQVWFW